MKKKIPKKHDTSFFHFRDFLVMVICLSSAAVSIFFFRLDLYQTFRSYNAKPAGLVNAKLNTVQRRMADRAVWDRLRKKSVIYSGDLIRVAQLSSALLEINGSSIELSENTLIKIQSDDLGPPQIELSSGSLCLISTGSNSGKIYLDIMGYRIETGPGTVLTADSGTDGMLLIVNEGSILVDENGVSKEASEGTAVYMNSTGGERKELTALIKKPRLYSRYINSTNSPINIDFAWSRINLDPQEALRLEFSKDNYFSDIDQAIDGLRVSAAVFLDNGIWFWRLLSRNGIIEKGQITIVDGRGPELFKPENDALISYRRGLSGIKFSWKEIKDASYFIEIAKTADFVNPEISSPVEDTYFISSKLNQGIWYWRVKTLFPSGFEGESIFSAINSFRVE